MNLIQQNTPGNPVNTFVQNGISLPQVLFMSTYPPRTCGIATFTHDLTEALRSSFSTSFGIQICAIESPIEKSHIPASVFHTLSATDENAFEKLRQKIEANTSINLLVVEHDFGLFENRERQLYCFLREMEIPVVIAFHTVLPQPAPTLLKEIKRLADIVQKIVVMTNSAATILENDYGISRERIQVIAHGVHLVRHADKKKLKHKYGMPHRKVLSNYGLLSRGKSIETALLALPGIIKVHPDVLFLIIGNTHPAVIRSEGESYREMLEHLIVEHELTRHVRFVHQFLPLPDLLEYLQLTDVYLFTSTEPLQAVSGTFAYALGCGCPIISTPIPQALEVKDKDSCLLIDFKDSVELTTLVNELLSDSEGREAISLRGRQLSSASAWENSAIAHAMLFKEVMHVPITAQYIRPPVKLDHLHHLSTPNGIIQFAKMDEPDFDSGYTLDDNARALIVCCMHYEQTADEMDIAMISSYLKFIQYCQQPNGRFWNYVDYDMRFTSQNEQTNLDDANGRAIWALGMLENLEHLLPAEAKHLSQEASETLHQALAQIHLIHSTRAMAFIIKGLYFRINSQYSIRGKSLLRHFANRLVKMYQHESTDDWQWFEGNLTYANAVLPEALLCAYEVTENSIYKDIAQTAMNFLIRKTFKSDLIMVVSNQGLQHKGKEEKSQNFAGQQPIDVAYSILALHRFYQVIGHQIYQVRMLQAFDWFMGRNSLQQIMYNPATGGCYGGLEMSGINLNQGAESTLSFLLSRLMLEKSNTIKAEQSHVLVSSRNG